MTFSALGIIPARMNSTRFPGKPLMKILGKPMIQWVYEQSQKAETLDDLLVATDTQEIFDTVKTFGGKAIMTKTSHLTGLDRIIEVSEKMDSFSHFINIQGDEPAIHHETIDGIVSVLKNNNARVATAGIKFNEMEHFKSPHQVKVVFNDSMKALYFSRSPIPYNENLSLDYAYKHLGIYGYEKTALYEIKKLKPGKIEQIEKLEQLRLLENNIDIYIYVTIHDSIGVDTPDDLKRAEQILKSKN
jgi:3-deoxy-manno-octulosonate cytidylyltransferase (CMP-KDO synthetase)